MFLLPRVVTYSTRVPSCDRPGCSEPVFLHYGFDPAAAVVWLEVPTDDLQSGLCRVHAERLTPPRGWTIDDRRDPTLRLFRPGPEDSRSPSKSRKRSTKKPSQRSQDSLFSRHDGVQPAANSSPLLSSSAAENFAEEETSTLSPLLSRAFRGTALADD